MPNVIYLRLNYYLKSQNFITSETSAIGAFHCDVLHLINLIIQQIVFITIYNVIYNLGWNKILRHNFVSTSSFLFLFFYPDDSEKFFFLIFKCRLRNQERALAWR